MEASLVIPFFLFFLLELAGIFMILMAEAHIHQALASATEYVAQYCYLEQSALGKDSDKKGNMNTKGIDVENLVDTALMTKQFQSHIKGDFFVGKVVSGGNKGILLTIKKDKENPKLILATAKYKVKITLPFLGTHSINLSNQIKQKAFVGFSEEEYNNENCYVFVTPNREAYHMRRDCTHLMLDIRGISVNRKEAYSACYYCGEDTTGGVVYIAKNGEVYHTKRECVGLKRTVRRVMRSSVEGIGACQRCGG